MGELNLQKVSFSLIAAILLLTAEFVQAETTITFLVEDDCPYSCRSESEMEQRGFIQDILKIIFERKGYKTNFKFVPWLRALKTFNEEDPSIDCMIGMKSHPIKKEIALYPDEEIARYTHRFYALKNSHLAKTWKYNGLGSLDNIKIGCVSGWTYCDKDITKYLAAGSEPYVQALNGQAPAERNFKRLLGQWIDLWVANKNNTEYLLAKERKAGNQNAEKIIGLDDLPITTDVNVYPIFYKNKKGLQYSEIFTQGIRELRRSGELNTIMHKYGISDWK